MQRDLTDAQLLEAFARRGDQSAFAQIVDRYAGLVYSAALRQVGAAHAEDASQAVFFILAQKAGTVDGRTLAGWLVNTARYAAMSSRRMEARRSQRERKAALMHHEATGNPADPQPEWERLAPLLDEALSKLNERDRSAVTLRYLQGKSVREVADAMSVSETAAGKRATRAIQTLRDYFARRGIKLSAEALGCALGAQGIVGVPATLTGKLVVTGTAGTAVSPVALTIAKGTVPLMLGAKTQVAAVLAAVVVLGGGVAIVATQITFAGKPVAKAPATAPANVQSFQAYVGVPPATQPVAPVDRTRETFTRYPTPPGENATFQGRVERLADPSVTEVGIVALRGTHWTSNANYTWQPVNSDGSFTITASTFPEARRALAVRSTGQSVTYVRAEFDATESARDIVVRMKPTRTITIAAHDSAGNPVSSFKAEIFDAGASGQTITDDDGRPIRPQRLVAPVSRGGLIEVPVPLEPLTVMVSGTGVAPFMQLIDPRTSDHFDFSLLQATPISVTLTDNGQPLANERVMLNNPAVAYSYTARTTDANGRLQVTAGIPGTYHIAVRDKTVDTQVIEGVPCEVSIDLAQLADPSKSAATLPTTMPTAQ